MNLLFWKCQDENYMPIFQFWLLWSENFKGALNSRGRITLFCWLQHDFWKIACMIRGLGNAQWDENGGKKWKRRIYVWAAPLEFLLQSNKQLELWAFNFVYDIFKIAKFISALYKSKTVSRILFGINKYLWNKKIVWWIFKI